MELSLMNADGSVDTKKVQVNDGVFGVDYNATLVHQILVAYMSAARAGTKAQKNRSAVSGGGRKPWRQKGTGRARSGTIRSPLWRSGGVTFAAEPRHYTKKVNKKMYRAAMRSIFSELAREQRLVVVTEFDFEEPKTRLAVEKVKMLGLERVLFITDNVTENLYLATRNVHYIDIMDLQGLSPVDLVDHDKILVTEETLKKIEAWLA